MRALEETTQRGLRFAQTYTIPAPVKGWNTIDPVANMDPLYAVALDNWIPQPGYLELRGGSQSWVSTLAAPGKSFIAFGAGSGRKLFVAAGSGLYDVSDSGISPVLVYSISSPDNWLWNGFSTSAGEWTIAANGADPTLKFDGSSWTPAAITGVNPSQLFSPAAYQGRLWFGQVGNLLAWYLAPAAIQGAAVEFDLGQAAKLGGSLAAVGSWSIDAGDGPREYLAFITTEGEAIIYQGTDPSSITTFSLVGVYRIPKPIGMKCLIRYAGDMLVLTQQGVYPLSKALLSATLDRSSAITYTISSIFASAYAAQPLSTDWAMALFTEKNLLLVNIPAGAPDGTNCQYVMNTLTGAWCRFIGINANAIIDYDGMLIYSQTGLTNSFIGQMLIGTGDFGNDIQTTILTAYNYLEQPIAQKDIKLVRPTLKVTDEITLYMGISVDFQDLQDSDYGPIDFPVITDPMAGYWDDTDWDDSTWVQDFFSPLQWCTPPHKVGFAIAVGVQSLTSTSTIQLASFDIAFELGQGIL